MTERITELKQKLQARTDNAGKPNKGYTRNVAAIRAEIAKLERQAPAAP